MLDCSGLLRAICPRRRFVDDSPIQQPRRASLCILCAQFWGCTIVGYGHFLGCGHYIWPHKGKSPEAVRLGSFNSCGLETCY